MDKTGLCNRVCACVISVFVMARSLLRSCCSESTFQTAADVTLSCSSRVELHGNQVGVPPWAGCHSHIQAVLGAHCRARARVCWPTTHRANQQEARGRGRTPHTRCMSLLQGRCCCAVLHSPRGQTHTHTLHTSLAMDDTHCRVNSMRRQSTAMNTAHDEHKPRRHAHIDCCLLDSSHTRSGCRLLDSAAALLTALLTHTHTHTHTTHTHTRTWVGVP
jgi:hypothetical protein